MTSSMWTTIALMLVLNVVLGVGLVVTIRSDQRVTPQTKSAKRDFPSIGETAADNAVHQNSGHKVDRTADNERLLWALGRQHNPRLDCRSKAQFVASWRRVFPNDPEIMNPYCRQVLVYYWKKHHPNTPTSDLSKMIECAFPYLHGCDSTLFDLRVAEVQYARVHGVEKDGLDIATEGFQEFMNPEFQEKSLSGIPVPKGKFPRN